MTATCLELLTRLISFDTASSDLPSQDKSNAALISFAEDYLQHLGFHTQVQQVAEGKLNLWARLRPELPAGLLLSGHTDTVPADPKRWSKPVLELKAEGDKIYGLGSADMKGALACYLCAAADFAAHKDRLQRDVCLLFTCEEETSMAGATAFRRKFLEEGLSQARLCLIGEPTSLHPVLAHKGYMAREIVLQGHSAHSSNPDAGRNAIYALSQAVQALQQLQEQFRQEQDKDFSVPYTTLNAGMVKGGDCINQVCSRVSLFIDVRPLRPLSSQELDKLLQERLSFLQEQGFEVKIITPYPDIACFFKEESADPAQAELLQGDLQLLLEQSGQSPLKVNYCTEASLLQDACQQCVIIGPGSIAQAHQPDEFTSRKELERYTDMVKTMFGHICLQ